MNYDFHLPMNLITGRDCVRNNAGQLAMLGKKCMIVTGKSSAVRSGALADIQDALRSQGIEWTLFDGVKPNPLLEDSYNAAEIGRGFGVEFVVGIGGGSPLDAAKAIAVYIPNPIEMMAVYDKANWKKPVLPIVAIGTTAGTGSEVAPHSVMTRPDGRKQSFSDIQTVPVLTFGDPKYTESLPWGFTVSTGLDALSHAVEGYFSVPANDMSDLYAKESTRILWNALRELEQVGEGGCISSRLREALYYGSVIAGFALARCGTCYVHRFSYYLTEDFDVPHGTACAVFLPDFIERQARTMPEKAEAFYAYVGCSREEMSALVGRLTDFDAAGFKMDDATIDWLVNYSVGTTGFVRTGPDGYGADEGRELLRRMFGK